MNNETHESKWAREWRESHGTHFVWISKHTQLFCDGAMMSGLEAIEPPTDPFKRWRLIVEFYRIWLEALENKFNELKQRFVQHAESSGYFSDENRAALEAIREEAAPVKKKLEEAEAELLKVTPYGLTPEGKAEAAIQAQKDAEFRAKVVAQISTIKF